MLSTVNFADGDVLCDLGILSFIYYFILIDINVINLPHVVKYYSSPYRKQ